MSITNAVISGFKQYRKLSGRTSRGEYWFFAAFFLCSVFVTGFMDRLLGTYFISGIYILAMIPPLLTASIRRLHDTDKSAVWLLALLIPGIGWFFLLIWLAGQSSLGVNRYGANPEYSGTKYM